MERVFGRLRSNAITAVVALPLGLGCLFSGSALGQASIDYEIWGSDQSNSRADAEAPGVSGSWLWIWDSQDIQGKLRANKAPQPLGCDGNNAAGAGPCNLHDVFPSNLAEHDSDGATGTTLEDLSGFGRLHGMLPDPQNRYMNLNIFAPDGGYVGIMDGESKAAIALFRVSGTSSGRSVHMSFWNADGSALLVANLHGKVLERIDVERDSDGKITQATLNRSAALGVGKGLQITDQPKVYLGNNAQGQPMLGSISGAYDTDALGDLTPKGDCKENGCAAEADGDQGGRPNNVIICPIVSDSNKAYITFGAGGLLVADTTTTPMTIVGEYGNQAINGAGCGGVQVNKNMWLNAGVSASSAGATQSTFTIYTLDDSAFSSTASQPEPQVIFRDSTNTATIGSAQGAATNDTGQLPGTTTRRDSHGMAKTTSGKFIHTVDRIQNTVEVINTETLERSTYDLTSANGKGQGLGACAATSVSDDPALPKNDPAPDLLEATPDGQYLVVALRGPIPVSVNHSAQGSCPGVGLIKLTQNGASGRLFGVLRSTNTVDNATGSAPGGHSYTGLERSDVHGAAVRRKSPLR